MVSYSFDTMVVLAWHHMVSSLKLHDCYTINGVIYFWHHGGVGMTPHGVITNRAPWWCKKVSYLTPWILESMPCEMHAKPWTTMEVKGEGLFCSMAFFTIK
jgi:hypothetical protein